MSKPPRVSELLRGDWPAPGQRCRFTSRPWHECGCRLCVAARKRMRFALAKQPR